MESLKTENPAWKELRRKPGLRQLGVHVAHPLRGLGKALRVTSNSETIIDAILKREPHEELETCVQKGCEVEFAKHSQKGLFNLRHTDDLHIDMSKSSFVDDTTGKTLDSKQTLDGRHLEMETFKEMGVYEYVRKDVAIQDRSGKMVGVRWVDVQKGPLVRSRLVAQEFAGTEERDDIFAATPPLFATKMCISDAASRGDYGKGERTLMILEV